MMSVKMPQDGSFRIMQRAWEAPPTFSRSMIRMACGVACGFLMIGTVSSAEAPGELWYQMPKDPPQTRWFTYENQRGEKGAGATTRFGRKGAPSVAFPKGTTLTLVDVKGGGTIRRIWATLWSSNPGPDFLRGIKIEAYWDGATNPAVQAPLGDFFCHGPGRMATFENACFASPEGRSFNCFIPMPFRQSAKIVLINESDRDTGVYYDVATTLGDKHGEDMLYFHSFWRRENYTQLRRDMIILPRVTGHGRFLGCNLGVRLHPAMTNFWWGEGEVKMYLDGDGENPTLCGTGTEDYIGTAYGQGRFSQRYTGNPFTNSTETAYGFYRFHIPDPVYFQNDLRVTIQAMGGPSYAAMLAAMAKHPELKFMKAGAPGQYYTKAELEKEPDKADVMERQDDHCATAYWYMDKPENGLGSLAPVAERLENIPKK